MRRSIEETFLAVFGKVRFEIVREAEALLLDIEIRGEKTAVFPWSSAFLVSSFLTYIIF